MLPDEYATNSDAEREEYLLGLSPEELLQLGIDLYNARHYWHAHEAWEEVWMEASREMRHFHQGLIQVAAAFVHIVRNEYPGAIRLLEAGIEKLERYPGDTLDVDVTDLLQGATLARKRLLELGEKRVKEFDRNLIPRIHRIGLPDRTS